MISFLTTIVFLLINLQAHFNVVSLQSILDQNVLLTTSFPTSHGAQIRNLNKNCDLTQSTSCSGFWSCLTSFCKHSTQTNLTHLIIRPNKLTTCNITHFSGSDLDDDLSGRYLVLTVASSMINAALIISASYAIILPILMQNTTRKIYPIHFIMFLASCEAFLCHTLAFCNFISDLRASTDDHPPAIISASTSYSVITLIVITVAEIICVLNLWSCEDTFCN